MIEFIIKEITKELENCDDPVKLDVFQSRLASVKKRLDEYKGKDKAELQSKYQEAFKKFITLKITLKVDPKFAELQNVLMDLKNLIVSIPKESLTDHLKTLIKKDAKNCREFYTQLSARKKTLNNQNEPREISLFKLQMRLLMNQTKKCLDEISNSIPAQKEKAAFFFNDFDDFINDYSDQIVIFDNFIDPACNHALAEITNIYNNYKEENFITAKSLQECIVIKKSLGDWYLAAETRAKLAEKTGYYTLWQTQFDALNDADKSCFNGVILAKKLADIETIFAELFKVKYSELDWNVDIAPYEEFCLVIEQFENFPQIYDQISTINEQIKRVTLNQEKVREIQANNTFPAFSITIGYCWESVASSIKLYQEPDSNIICDNVISILNAAVEEFDKQFNILLSFQSDIENYKNLVEVFEKLPVFPEIPAEPSVFSEISDENFQPHSGSNAAELLQTYSGKTRDNQVLYRNALIYCRTLKDNLYFNIKKLEECIQRAITGEDQYELYYFSSFHIHNEIELSQRLCAFYFAHFEKVREVNIILLRNEYESEECMLQQSLNLLNVFLNYSGQHYELDAEVSEDYLNSTPYNIEDIYSCDSDKYQQIVQWFDDMLNYIGSLLKTRKEKIDIKDQQLIAMVKEGIDRMGKKLKFCLRSKSYEGKGEEILAAQELYEKMQANLDDYLSLKISRSEFENNEAKFAKAAADSILSQEQEGVKGSAVVRTIYDFFGIKNSTATQDLLNGISDYIRKPGPP